MVVWRISIYVALICAAMILLGSATSAQKPASPASFSSARVTVTISACNAKTGEKKTSNLILYIKPGSLDFDPKPEFEEKAYEEWRKRNPRGTKKAWTKYWVQAYLKSIWSLECGIAEHQRNAIDLKNDAIQAVNAGIDALEAIAILAPLPPAKLAVPALAAMAAGNVAVNAYCDAQLGKVLEGVHGQMAEIIRTEFIQKNFTKNLRVSITAVDVHR